MTLADSGITKEMLAERGTPALLRHHLEPSYQLYDHIQLMSQITFKSVFGLGPNRIIVSVPPRYGKTALLSQALALWFLDWFPDRRVILASYSSELAKMNGRWVRNMIEGYPDKLRVRLSPDSRSAGRWNTPQGGGLLAAGVGASMTGFGSDLLVIDDAVSNWEDAHSPVKQQEVWNWYGTVARTRLQSRGVVVVVGTRWGEDDLIGRLLKAAEEGEGEQFLNVRIPAIADHDPDLGETDPLGREPGEVICEDLFNLEDVEAQMLQMRPVRASGLMQQRPAPDEGTMFRRDHWAWWEDEVGEDADPPPRSEFRGFVRGWDLAATEAGGNYTAGVLLGRHKDGRTFVLDVVRAQLGVDGVKTLIEVTASNDRKQWGRRVGIRIERQPGASGLVWAEDLTAHLQRFGSVQTIPSSGDKAYRAMPWASALAAGKVVLCPTESEAHYDDFMKEHAQFPEGRNDDMVDAAGLAYSELKSVLRGSAPIRYRSSKGRVNEYRVGGV